MTRAWLVQRELLTAFFAPAVAIPAAIITYSAPSRFLRAIVVSHLGGHVLPYARLYQTNVDVGR